MAQDLRSRCILAAAIVAAGACSAQFNMSDSSGDVEAEDAGDVAIDATDTPDAADVPHDVGECGNSEVEDGEECDDGANGDPDDGCTDECTYSCHGAVECRDTEPCNGEESCNTEFHTCEPGERLDDGALVSDGPPRTICLDGVTHESTCGDGFVDDEGGEFCDPPGSGGCMDGCVWGCDTDTECPDDGAVCNGEEYCDLSSHVCARRSVPVAGSPCSDGQFCTAVDECNGSGSCVGSGNPCDDSLGCTDNTCSESGGGTCTTVIISGNCLVGGTCYGSGAPDPGNACRWCNPSVSSTSFANHDGAVCTDDGLTCTSDVCAGGACTHPVGTGCLIGGTCRSELALNPSNDCERCHHATDPLAWSPVPTGTACADDGFTCTSDACDGLRSCNHIITSGRCLISGICYSSGDRNPSNICQQCDPSRSPTSWSPNIGTSCDDGDYCTTSDACTTSGTCMGALVSYLYGVEEIEGAYFSACARLGSGGVRCWGSNSQGTLGDGTTTTRPGPVAVIGLTASATDIGAGNYHVCAVQTGGTVRCWGNNDAGQIGDGTKGTDRTTATAVTGLGSAAEVCGGSDYSCARRTTGYVVCWGSSEFGQLGNGTSGTGAESLTYVTVLGPGGSGSLTNIVEISCGAYHVCARNSSNQIFCWGRNNNGQLGIDSWSSTDLRAYPVAVWRAAGDSTQLVADELSSGGLHSCARQGGSVKCWGYNADGQCGNGTTSTPQDAPVNVLVSFSVPLSDATELDLGYRHSCVMASGGSVRCWGDDAYGQLGDGATTDSPFVVAVRTSSTPTYLSGTTGLGLGGWTSYAIINTADNVIAWGQGTNSQIGDGGTTNRAYPVYANCSD